MPTPVLVLPHYVKIKLHQFRNGESKPQRTRRPQSFSYCAKITFVIFVRFVVDRVGQAVFGIYGMAVKFNSQFGIHASYSPGLALFEPQSM